jgi:hypothetical protein
MCKFVGRCKHVCVQSIAYILSDLKTQTFRIACERLIVVWDLSFSKNVLIAGMSRCIFFNKYFKTFRRYLFPSSSGWSSLWRLLSKSYYLTQWVPNVFFPQKLQIWNDPEVRWSVRKCVYTTCDFVTNKTTLIYFCNRGIICWSIVFLCCWNEILAAANFKVIVRWKQMWYFGW